MRDKIIFDSKQEKLIYTDNFLKADEVRFIISLGDGLIEVIYENGLRMVTNKQFYFISRRLDGGSQRYLRFSFKEESK